MIDLTGKMGVDVGSEVEVFGKQNSINDLGGTCQGRFHTELTCAVSKRVPQHLYQKWQSCGERTSVKRIEEYGCSMEIQMNKRTADYIADQLADQILSGAIQGGTPLKQEELSGLLGASRIPVREALQIIEHQGLAVRLATRHVVTADFSDAHIREIYGIIGDIERRVLCDLAASEQQGENPGIFVEETLTELEFHRRIYGMTDNAYVRNILKNAVECYVRFAISLPRQETGSADAEYRKGTEWQDGFWQKQEVKSRQLSADELRGAAAQMEPYYEELAARVVTERGKHQ